MRIWKSNLLSPLPQSQPNWQTGLWLRDWKLSLFLISIDWTISFLLLYLVFPLVSLPCFTSPRSLSHPVPGLNQRRNSKEASCKLLSLLSCVTFIIQIKCPHPMRRPKNSLGKGSIPEKCIVPRSFPNPPRPQAPVLPTHTPEGDK